MFYADKEKTVKLECRKVKVTTEDMVKGQVYSNYKVKINGKWLQVMLVDFNSRHPQHFVIIDSVETYIY